MEMITPVATPKITEILKRLMFEKDIKAMDLARLTGLPQPTVQRMVAGTTPNPHLSSLIPIAQFFEITIEQLKGLEPISWLESVANRTKLIPIPVISWDEAAHWHELKKSYQATDATLFMETKVGPHAFALTIEDASMYPLFPEGTQIILDPDKPLKDRSYVAVNLKGNSKAVFRQLLIDFNHHYLKAVSPDLEHFPLTLMQEGDRICGILIQARHDFEK